LTEGTDIKKQTKKNATNKQKKRRAAMEQHVFSKWETKKMVTGFTIHIFVCGTSSCHEGC
jgi:hypothetical protein